MFVHLCLALAYMHQSVSIHYGEKIPAKNVHTTNETMNKNETAKFEGWYIVQVSDAA